MKILPLLFIPLLAFADPAVNQVRVNIYNETKHPIQFKSFDSVYIFESAAFAQKTIPAQSSVQEAILFTAFDKSIMTAGVDIVINDQPMKLMWQTNMGFGGPEDDKFHLCGVIKDGEAVMLREYCDIPYVVGETLMVDFTID